SVTMMLLLMVIIIVVMLVLPASSASATRLGSGECQQRDHIVGVRCFQRSDIALAYIAGRLQIGASPRKPLAPEAHDEQVSHQPGVPAVAVGERVNLYKPVMEANCNLIGRIGFIFDPGFRVVEQLAYSHRYFVERNPEIAFGLPELSRPAPYIAQHVLVQI